MVLRREYFVLIHHTNGIVSFDVEIHVSLQYTWNDLYAPLYGMMVSSRGAK